MMLRNVQTEDAAEIARLSTQLGYPADESEVCRRISWLMEDGENAVFVMEVDGKLAGWVHVQGRLALESAPFAEIGGLVVDDICRRMGVGRKLIDSCVEWTKAKGYRTLRVRSNGLRTEAHRFYESCGFTNTKWQQVFHMNFEDDRG
ncbi:GNAT family N-acetyltransferase [Gorillibacterium massiliense]|uniref:GNAT family N-acetyltransferase n=1 Tax=Gorillibacterium massiliense TaxID=1280390 RepID=UPI000593BD50|nr:GNAT family N-acetyltransferase [Gorillibacterium massiliense]